MYIIADIGGTKTRIAGTTDTESFGQPVILDTPKTYADSLELLCDTARAIAGTEPIEGFVAGITGVLDKRTGTTHHSNTPDFNEKAFAQDIGAALKTEVHLENDTALVGLGEAVHGAGKGADIVVYMTVSTGVNAARIVGGRIDQGNFNSETGDQYIFVDAVPRQLGDMISGGAVQAKYGMHPKEIGKDSPIWEELAKLTAYGLYNSIVHWSPDTVVLGGSMFNEIGISVPRVEEHIREINKKYPLLPKIMHSSLGDVGGLYGGLALLRQPRS